MIHETHREWLEGRAIDPDLAERLGLKTVKDGSAHWLVAEFREAGVLVNRKWRLTSQKRFKMDKGAELAFWNADALKRAAGGTLVITEGEMDALAAIQSGKENTVSVPQGAPSEPTKDLGATTKYDFIDRHWDDLEKIDTFILATDADKQGYALRADLVRLLGAERCRFVEFREGAKDLNDVKMMMGEQEVVRCLDASRPVPTQGLYKISEFPDLPEIEGESIGVPELDQNISLVFPALYVITGYANSGKSTLLDPITASCIERGFPVCRGDFETLVKPILQNDMRRSLLGCGKHDLDRADLREVDALIDERLTVITQMVDEDLEMTLDDFLATAAVAVRQHGSRVVILDPWNEIEHKRPDGVTETEYVGVALRKIKSFMRRYRVAFFLVAHPPKIDGGAKRPPGMYDIAGSAKFADKADYGITYHRPDPEQNYAEVIINKVRKGYPGRRGKVPLTYDFRCSRFTRAA